MCVVDINSRVCCLAAPGYHEGAALVTPPLDYCMVPTVWLPVEWQIASITTNRHLPTIILTHCGLVTPYGDIDLDQHWLTAPSHYLNQCWVIISAVQWYSSGAISQEITQLSITEMYLKITYLKFRSKLPGPNVLTYCGLLIPATAVNMVNVGTQRLIAWTIPSHLLNQCWLIVI